MELAQADRIAHARPRSEPLATPLKVRRVVLACCCYSPYIRGGAEIANQRLVNALREAGYDITVISIGDSDAREIVDGIAVIRVRSTNVHWLYRSKQSSKPAKVLWHVLDAINWAIAYRIGKLLDELQPDCLITSTIEDISTFTWHAAKRRGIRTIDILHSYYLLCYSGAMFRNGKNCTGQCVGCFALCRSKKINSANVDDVIGVSRFVLNKHLDAGLFKNSRTHVIPNIGFDTEILAPTLREQVNGFLRIGYLGRLHPTKGIQRIIDAIARLQCADSFRVVIAGDGDANYKRELQNAGEVQGVALTFLGHVSPSELFAQIDYLVVPSVWQEPFGLVLTEAARAGIPVLAARIGGMPEIVGNDMGLCFSSVEELSSLLVRLLYDRPQFSFSSLQRFEKKTIVNQWRALLDSAPRAQLSERHHVS